MNDRTAQNLRSGNHKWIWLSLASLILSHFVAAQQIGYYKLNYLNSYISVSYADKDGKAVTTNEIYLTALKPNAGVDIYFNKLQTIKEFDVYQKQQNTAKYSKITPVAEVTGAESGFIYSGLNRVIIYLPDTGRFRINYTLQTNDLMLAGSIYLADENFDSVRYSYKVPSKLKLLYKIDGDSSCFSHRKGDKTEDFTIYPNQTLSDYYLFQEQQMLQMPVSSNLRVLIVPVQFADKPETYFSDWYFRLLGDNRNLNAVSKRIADSICGDLSDTISIINALFRYINQKINYVGLFDKWNAFIPQPVDEVLQKRFGDCKNMANLLTCLLRYKGIEAYYGITASVYHPVDMDFPSLASGDHAICVVKAKGDWMFLDPTNKLSLELIPPGYIQGRTVLVMDQKSPFYLKVPVRAADQNLEVVNNELHIVNNTLHGSFNARLTGYLRQEIIGLYYANGGQLFPELLSDAILGSYFEYSVNSIFYSMDDSTFTVTGKINYPDFNIEVLKNGNLAIFTDFIQVPREFTVSNQKFEMITGEPKRYELNYNFQFDHPVKLCPYIPVLYEDNGLVYKFVVTQTAPERLNIHVIYEIPYSIIRIDDLDNLKACSQLIYHTMRNAIELQ